MIVFENAGVSHGAGSVFSGVSFRINGGERVGIIGPNGSGKTTLLEVITGAQSLHEGVMRIEGAPTLGRVRQVPAAGESGDSLLTFACQAAKDILGLATQIRDVSEALAQTEDFRQRERLQRRLGAAQTAFEHSDGYSLEARVKSALSGLGFSESDFDRPFDTFSGGWRMRAELVRTLAQTPDLLLLDEPSNYLDSTAVEWLQRFLRAYRGTLLLISHDRFLLQSLTTVTLEVDAGTITRYEGDLTYYQRERVRRHQTQWATRRNVERKRAHMQRFVERFRAQSAKAPQVQSRLKALARLPSIAVPRGGDGCGAIRVASPKRSGAQVVRFESVSFAYDARHDFVLKNVDFVVNRGDRVAVVGFNGMGKTTLLRLMAARIAPTRGHVITGYHVTPGYQAQAFAETLSPSSTVFQCLREVAPRAVPEVEIRAVLGSFGFSGDTVVKTCDVLSGGERIRLAFAQLFVQQPNFLILDEPTTHLDLEGRRSLENVLARYEGTVCMVSHDIAFLKALATRVLHVASGTVQMFDGGYDAYHAALSAIPAPGSAVQSSLPMNTELPSSARDRRRERAAERERTQPRLRELRDRLAKLEARIMALEAEQAQWIATLADTSITDHAAVHRRMGELQVELDTANRDWEQTGSELLAQSAE